jgi:PhnB protein
MNNKCINNLINLVQISPYINFNGKSEMAFNFYKSVFGGAFAQVTRFSDMSTPAFAIAEKETNKIMYIALMIDKNVLMGNDFPEFMGKVN